MALTESFLDERRERLRAAANPAVNGIDSVAVDPESPRKIRISLVHPAPGQSAGVPTAAPRLEPDDLVLRGGDRIRGISIQDMQVDGRHIDLVVDQVGDFSDYQIAITAAGFDTPLAQISFGFRAGCPADFEASVDEEEPQFAQAQLDYLAKDYDSFRQLMLDRMAQTVPDWTDRHAADLGVTLVELMAHYADHLSYAQDAVASEAYLETARRRASVKRHAQLVGYQPHEGASARLWVHLTSVRIAEIARGDLSFVTPIDGKDDTVIFRGAVELDKLARRGVRVFEPVSDVVRVNPAHNALPLHDWGDARAVLPKGAVRAWIQGSHSDVQLRAGDFLSLEALRDPATRRRADVDVAARQIVRLSHDPEPMIDHLGAEGPVEIFELHWFAEDALRFDLGIGALAAEEVPDVGPARMGMAYGNIVLADHGVSLQDVEDLGIADDPDDPEDVAQIARLSDLDRPQRFSPVLRHTDISITVARPAVDGISAMAVAEQTDATSVPSITLDDGRGAPWLPVTTLLFAGPTERVFVAEAEADGQMRLRFGTGDTGGAPPPSDAGGRLVASYRIGVGRAGNIGAEALGHIVSTGDVGLVSVRNPQPGFGGRDRESIAQMRVAAPASIMQNQRAVTLDDYARMAERHPLVARARTRRVFQGGWETYFVAVDPVGDTEISDVDLASIRATLEPFRMMGQDIEVERPRFAPIELTLRVCVADGYGARDVLGAVQAELSSDVLASGRLGLFHPDTLSFGEPIYLSRIYERVRGVAGVVDVAVDTFRRWRTTGRAAIENGVLEVGEAEIPILANDPNYPDRGVLRVTAWEMAQ